MRLGWDCRRRAAITRRRLSQLRMLTGKTRRTCLQNRRRAAGASVHVAGGGGAARARTPARAAANPVVMEALIQALIQALVHGRMQARIQALVLALVLALIHTETHAPIRVMPPVAARTTQGMSTVSRETGAILIWAWRELLPEDGAAVVAGAEAASTAALMVMRIGPTGRHQQADSRLLKARAAVIRRRRLSERANARLRERAAASRPCGLSVGSRARGPAILEALRS